MDGPNRVLQFYGVLNEFIGFVLITNNSNNMNMQLNECYNFTLYKYTYTHTWVFVMWQLAYRECPNILYHNRKFSRLFPTNSNITSFIIKTKIL